jgi:diacylglycerol kinase
MPIYQKRSLVRKFGSAFRGWRRGVRAESNFFVHLFVADLVVAAGLVLRVSWLEWCLLALCIASVLAAEMFNTAIEHLAKAVTREENDLVRDALDMSSAAVLLTSIGAAIVGLTVLVHHLALQLGWWKD